MLKKNRNNMKDRTFKHLYYLCLNIMSFLYLHA